MKRLALIVVMGALGTSCVNQQVPTPRGAGGGADAGGGTGIEPDACQMAGDAGRKVRMFLIATVALDGAVTSAYQEAHAACRDMGAALDLPPATLDADVKELCNAVAVSIQEHLESSEGSQATVTVKHKPAVCRVDVEAAARVSAECEGSASADIQATCSGVCRGDCAGTCQGACASKNAAGECNGACDGTCKGSCRGECEGHADVNASAECEAAAEVEANVSAKCDPPELEVTIQKSGGMDEAKQAKVKAAIAAGLPRLLMLRAKLQGPVRFAFATWARSVGGLRDVGAGMGAAAVCVSGQMAAAAAAMVQIEARISITVEASASVSAAAGAN